MWVQAGRAIHFACTWCALCVCMCVYVSVLLGGQDEPKIKGREVVVGGGGGGHHLNPPLLTCEQRDVVERSTAN